MEETVTEGSAVKQYAAQFGGRLVMIREINDAQRMILSSMLRQLKSNPGQDAVVSIFAKLFNLINHLIISDEDRQWLEDEILAGNLDIDDFAVIFQPASTPVEPAAAKKPRRGR